MNKNDAALAFTMSRSEILLEGFNVKNGWFSFVLLFEGENSSEYMESRRRKTRNRNTNTLPLQP